MSLLSVFLIGVGLSMDAFAVSVAKGMVVKNKIWKCALILGFWFGLFQGLMPLLGYAVGIYFSDFIRAIDHWIAFGLLLFIGINMIKESFHEEESDDSLSLKSVLVLAIATSIDALAVGVSFAFLQVDIISAVVMIGITTFVLSMIAVFIGNKIGGVLEKYAGIFGGIILILIGTKILIEHLFF